MQWHEWLRVLWKGCVHVESMDVRGERRFLSSAGAGPRFQPGIASQRWFNEAQIKGKQAKRLDQVTEGEEWIYETHKCRHGLGSAPLFREKKKKNEPIPHMTSRQRSWSRPRWCLEWGCSHTRPTSANGVCSTLMHVGESLRPSGFEHLEQKHGSYHRTHIFISSMAKLTAFLKIQRINMQPPACFYRLMFPHFWGRQQMQKLSDVQTIH